MAPTDDRATLVDANVILDVLTADPAWLTWSARELQRASDAGVIAINPIIYAEVAAHFETIEALDDALDEHLYTRRDLPWEAGFLAGRCFVEYRRRGGERRSPMPDFYIGAHAAITDMALLTRDAKRYRTYFPGLKLIAP